jgi:hypothetical protein
MRIKIGCESKDERQTVTGQKAEPVPESSFCWGLTVFSFAHQLHPANDYRGGVSYIIDIPNVFDNPT